MLVVLFILALAFAIGAIIIACICGQPIVGIIIAMWVATEINDVIKKEN